MIKSKCYFNVFFNRLLHDIRALGNKSRKNLSLRGKTPGIAVNRSQVAYFYLTIILFSGAAAGAFISNTMDVSQFSEISDYLSKFISSLEVTSIDNNDILMDIVFKYAKTTLVIWIMGFLSYGVLITIITLFAKGLACGFTTALLLRQLGMDGLIFGAVSYLPQNLLLIPMYIGLSFCSINQAKKIKNMPLKRRYLKRNKKSLIDYFFVLIACLIILFIASAVECYIIPAAMKKVAMMISLP